MLTPEVIDFIADTIKNQLQAHDSDLAEEMAASEEGNASVTFSITLYHITDEKLGGKIRTRIPRSATVTMALLPDFKQETLPGMR